MLAFDTGPTRLFVATLDFSQTARIAGLLAQGHGSALAAGAGGLVGGPLG